MSETRNHLSLRLWRWGCRC